MIQQQKQTDELTRGPFIESCVGISPRNLSRKMLEFHSFVFFSNSTSNKSQ